MKKLQQNCTGEYTIDNNPVTPILVRGPYLNQYDLVDGKIYTEEQVIKAVIAEIKKSGIDLEKIANSYTSAGCTISVARTNKDGKPVKSKEKRMEIFSFYKSSPKGLN
jgi:hypothetical protein